MGPKLSIWPKNFFEKFHPSHFFYLMCPIILQSVKKIFCQDTMNWACIILGRNWVKIAHLAQKLMFLEIHFSGFFVLSVPYHATKFEKKILEVDPVIKACIVMGHNRDEIAHFAQKTYLFLLCCKIWNKFLERIPTYKLA